jgi:hypothetical protein
MQIYVEKDIEPSAPKPRNDKANAGVNAGLTQRNRNVVATTFHRMKKGMAGGLGKGSKSVHSEVAQEGSSKVRRGLGINREFVSSLPHGRRRGRWKVGAKGLIVVPNDYWSR